MGHSGTTRGRGTAGGCNTRCSCRGDPRQLAIVFPLSSAAGGAGSGRVARRASSARPPRAWPAPALDANHGRMGDRQLEGRLLTNVSALSVKFMHGLSAVVGEINDSGISSGFRYAYGGGREFPSLKNISDFGHTLNGLVGRLRSRNSNPALALSALKYNRALQSLAELRALVSDGNFSGAAGYLSSIRKGKRKSDTELRKSQEFKAMEAALRTHLKSIQ